MPAAKQRVAITGGSGLIGTALSTHLRGRGDEVVHLVRRAPRTSAEIRWEPGETLDPQALKGVRAVVHLAGAGVGDHRWTDDYKQTIYQSRVDGTHSIATAVAALPASVVLISGSAIGVYGTDRGDEEITESSADGPGFLADVVRAWEGAARPASDGGHRVVFARTGLVMSPQGGSFGRILPLAKLGLGGPLGNGQQYWSWITLADHVRALTHLLDDKELSGPVNMVGPAPARQVEVMAELGRALHRPAVLPAPALALRAVLGEFASDVLGSQRVLPAALEQAGFTFDSSTLPQAVRWLVEQDRSS